MTNTMRDTLLKARDWFVRATAPGDAGDNYLNDGGWNEVEDILGAINAAVASEMKITPKMVEAALDVHYPDWRFDNQSEAHMKLMRAAINAALAKLITEPKSGWK